MFSLRLWLLFNYANFVCSSSSFHFQNSFSSSSPHSLYHKIESKIVNLFRFKVVSKEKHFSCWIKRKILHWLWLKVNTGTWSLRSFSSSSSSRGEKPQAEGKGLLIVVRLLYLFMSPNNWTRRKEEPRPSGDKSCSTIIFKEAQKVSEESARKSAIIRQRNDHKNVKYTALSYPPSPFGSNDKFRSNTQITSRTLDSGTGKRRSAG